MNLVKVSHRAVFAPVKSTWVKAIKKGNFIKWSDTNEIIINKHLSSSIATAMEHLWQEYQGI